MNAERIMIGVVGLLLGVAVTGFVAGQAVNNENSGMMRMMGMKTSQKEQNVISDHRSLSMDGMNKELESLTGDEFDKAFIEMMIAHHEGAITMAELSAERAMHSEIKQLSQEIIAAQEKEITDMKQWQQDWNYGTDEAGRMMHGSY